MQPPPPSRPFPPSSSSALPPTALMPSTPPIHPLIHSSIPPAMATVPRKGPSAKTIVLGLGGGCLGLVVLGCLATGALGYDGGTDFEEEAFTVVGRVVVDETGQECAEIAIEGGPPYASYELEGPGADSVTCCLGSFCGASGCRVPLTEMSPGDLSYTVRARGTRASFMEIVPMGETPVHEATVEVERPLSLAWSEARSATVCLGARCEIRFQRDGSLGLLNAAPGTTVRWGEAPSSGTRIAIHLASVADGVGMQALLHAPAGARTTLSGVSVRLPDGASFTGDVEIPTAEVARAVLSRLSSVDADGLGPATGDAALWLQDGEVRTVTGAPQRVADIGRVLVATTTAVSAGRCGPYALFGMGQGEYVPRERSETTVVELDRREGRVRSTRRFRGPVPRCPRTVRLGGGAITQRDTRDAEAYARDRLTDA